MLPTVTVCEVKREVKGSEPVYRLGPCRVSTSYFDKRIDRIRRSLLTHLLTPLSRVLLEKLTILSQSKNSAHFMQPVGSLPQSQMPATCPYPEPARSSPYPNIPLIQFNIILASIPGSIRSGLVPSGFPHQNPVYASPLNHTRYMPRPSNSSRFYYPNNTG